MLAMPEMEAARMPGGQSERCDNSALRFAARGVSLAFVFPKTWPRPPTHRPGSLTPVIAVFRSMAAALAASFALATVSAAEPTPAPFTFETYLLAPVHVHLFTARDEPALCTTLKEEDLRRIFGKVNRIWSQAGICFQVESISREEPAPLAGPVASLRQLSGRMLRRLPAAGYQEGLFNVYYLKAFDVNGIFFPKAIFVQDTAELNPVEGGIDEPLPRVTAHELGHALSLVHRQDTFNLMASGTTGASLNAAEIAQAREKAASIAWFARAPDLLAKADALQAEGRLAEAHVLYLRLAALPLEGEPLTRIRQVAGN
jgi:hypothetical protein